MYYVVANSGSLVLRYIRSHVHNLARTGMSTCIEQITTDRKVQLTRQVVLDVGVPSAPLVWRRETHYV